MAHLVFISHSSQDSAIARQVSAFLESKQISCWISSRDIPAGSDWTESIMDGITRSKVLVLIFSPQSNKSTHVQREVQQAFEHGVNVIPLIIEDCEPAKKLQFYFTGVQWMNACSRPIEPHLETLATAIRILLESGQMPDLDSEPVRESIQNNTGGPLAGLPTGGKKRSGRSRFRQWMAAAVVLLCATAALASWFIWSSRGDRVILGDHISTGEEIIRRGNPDPDMQSGTQAYARGDYALASDYFERVWKSTQDQEALVYLNNARLDKDKVPTCTIAVVIPVSRTGGPSGDEILKGVAQAQQEVNDREGRIKNGVGLKIAIASDVFGQEDDSTRATQVASDLVADRKILGVIGHFSSDVTRSVIPIYQGHKALITPTSTAEDLIAPSDDPKKQYAFRTIYRDSETASALVDYLAERHDLQGASVFYSKGSVYCESLLKQFTASYSAKCGRLPDDSVFDLASAAFDADEYLSRAQKSGSQVLVLFPSSKTIDAAFQLLEKAKQPEYSNFKLVLSGDSLGYIETLQRGATTSGLVSVVPWRADVYGQMRFAQDAAKLWTGTPAVWQMALSYDATQCFVTAIAAQLPASADSVQAALVANDFKAAGATGQIRFIHGNRLSLTPQLVQVKRTSDSSGKYSFVPFTPGKTGEPPL